MDYEQKYKEALERARMINNGEDVDVEAGTTTCEYIFPELKESEDERIRQYLITYFSNIDDCASNLKGKDVVAWLEKQDFTWSEEDERMYSIVFEEYKNRQYYSHPNLESRDINGEILDWFKSIKQRIGG